MMISKGSAIRYLLFIMVLFSIAISYYTKIVIDDYEILGNEDGLPVLEE